MFKISKPWDAMQYIIYTIFQENRNKRMEDNNMKVKKAHITE